MDGRLWPRLELQNKGMWSPPPPSLKGLACSSSDRRRAWFRNQDAFELVHSIKETPSPCGCIEFAITWRSAGGEDEQVNDEGHLGLAPA